MILWVTCSLLGWASAKRSRDNAKISATRIGASMLNNGKAESVRKVLHVREGMCTFAYHLRNVFFPDMQSLICLLIYYVSR